MQINDIPIVVLYLLFSFMYCYSQQQNIIPNQQLEGVSNQYFLTEKTFKDDMSYYYRMCKLKKDLTVNDKLYILYRIRNKYKDTKIDITPVNVEISKLESQRNKTQKLNIILPGKYIEDDMAFYFRYSKENNLTTNDRLSILYKIRDKYKNQDVDTTILNDEIKRLEPKWATKKPKIKYKKISIKPVKKELVTKNSVKESVSSETTTQPYISVSSITNIIYGHEQTTPTIKIIKRPEYIIHTDDILGIKIYPNVELSCEVFVQPDGSINLPLVGDVIAAGLTIEKLSKFLEKSYSRYIVNPKVTVNIRQFSEDEVLITGEIHNPGVYTYKEDSTILDMISKAGGFTTSANIKEIKIHRGKYENRKIILVNAEEIINDQTKNIVIERGDIIEIPKTTKKISVIGAVVSPGNYDYIEGIKVFDAVSSAGGPIKSAKLSKVKIFRQTESKREIIDLNLDTIIKGKTDIDIELKPGDIVLVPYK